MPEVEEPLVLSVDTATERRSVAVVKGGRVLACVEGQAQQGHAAGVLSDVDKALRACGAGLGDIELFAAAVGPGSFTGLRSGLATLKAFASTLGRPVAAVPTLHAVASAAGSSGLTWAMIPAGRGEVFAQPLEVKCDGEVVEFSAPVHAPPAHVVDEEAARARDVLWAGAGAERYASLLRDGARRAGVAWAETPVGEEEHHTRGARVWKLARAVQTYAAAIASLGLSYRGAGRLASAEALQALYVRPSDAELKDQCRA